MQPASFLSPPTFLAPCLCRRGEPSFRHGRPPQLRLRQPRAPPTCSAAATSSPRSSRWWATPSGLARRVCRSKPGSGHRRHRWHRPPAWPSSWGTCFRFSSAGGGKGRRHRRRRADRRQRLAGPRHPGRVAGRRLFTLRYSSLAALCAASRAGLAFALGLGPNLGHRHAA